MNTISMIRMSNARLLRATLLCGALCGGLTGCATFPERVISAQREINDSFAKIGYSTRDAIDSSSTPRDLKGRQWYERSIVFRDRGAPDWRVLAAFFRHKADYSFDCDVAVSECESDVLQSRQFEIKLDHLFTVYRIEFRRMKSAAERATYESGPPVVEEREPIAIMRTKSGSPPPGNAPPGKLLPRK